MGKFINWMEMSSSGMYTLIQFEIFGSCLFQLSCECSFYYRFLRTGSTAKKPKSKPYMGFDMDSSQDNYDELLGLCSGRFQGV